ncbi:DUF6087 family protein [Streptomyces sp. R11]|uniref:DUF6087 family protein n=1 Tax=Streptomyces sp. R11 TaxID=3238625 RepID=A0AB39NDI1_9ACTN
MATSSRRTRTVAEEEPLHEWAARRDRRGAAEREMTGTRRAVPLTDGARASHVAPNGPRAPYSNGMGRHG